jgi:hypothetical protein
MTEGGSSSVGRRYKQIIQRMDDTTAVLYALKPIIFRYKPQVHTLGPGKLA